MLYTPKHKMADLMTNEPSLLFIINRFGIPFGVEDKTIDEVCSECGIDTDTFLTVINFLKGHQPTDLEYTDIPTLRKYLSNSHNYYLNFNIPLLRRTLIEAMPSEDDHQVVILILRYFDSFAALIRRHIQQEESGALKTHEHDDVHIANKLAELTNLIIKYYPREHSEEYGSMLVNALSLLRSTEQAILAHCEIEDKILRPALQQQGNDDKLCANDALSDRETEVLVLIVRGLLNKEIADKLCISIHTVISHRKNIVRKLGIHSTAGLTIYAVVNNLVPLSDLKSNLPKL